MRAAARATLAACALWAAAGVAEPDPATPAVGAPAPEPTEVPAPPPAADAVLRVRGLDLQLGGAESDLRANVRDADGAWAYVRGRMEYRLEGRIRAHGLLELSTRPHPRAPALTTEQIERLVAHEFGHVLGLGHCLDCDSAMNDSWHTRERVFVTPADVKTYLLLAQPNGVRHEGGPLAGLARPGWSLAESE